ncbi:MAG: site-2 protease family protein [Candidatus Pacebacteria bacterium]|nr:site-2 protease family protein [Candidatus Paceibacterota bacterium]MDD5445660.1 site-2 protease family protein [Candidatus Paceibacterota bacterium]
METIFIIVILILSVIIHEVAHGAMANYMGDPTAKYAGRLTLNPIKHIDPIGSVVIPLLLVLFQSGVIFGWAKPVPINPYNFKDQKYGSAKVSAAGPFSNFSLALVFGLSMRFLPLSPNLLFIFGIIVYINLVLGIFNLIPIPPLDGSHILFTFLPLSMEHVKIFLSQYGLFILLFLIFFLLGPIFSFIAFIFELISGISFSQIIYLLG